MFSVNTALILEDLPSPPASKTGWPWTEQIESLPELMPDGLEWPRISIVTPSYNQGQFIEETIRSVLLQGYPNLEYIIIDGDSQDNSSAHIKKYSSWLAYWTSEADSGQADALNKGFAHATGQICAYLNSDDLLMPNTLQSVAIAFQQSSCYWLASRVLIGSLVQQAEVWEPNSYCFASFVVQQSFAQQGVFWRSDIVDKPYFESTCRYIMDHYFFVRIYAKYNAPYILRKTTAFFRIHDASKTSMLQYVLEEEKSELIERMCLQSSSSFSKQIRLEKKRSLLKTEAHHLLTTNPKSFQGRVSTAIKAIELLIKDPYPFRDRIFWSLTIKVLIRLVVLFPMAIAHENTPST